MPPDLYQVIALQDSMCFSGYHSKTIYILLVTLEYSITLFLFCVVFSTPQINYNLPSVHHFSINIKPIVHADKKLLTLRLWIGLQHHFHHF